MSGDTFMKDDEGTVYSYDNLTTSNWLQGHLGGLDACVAYLKKKAVDLFTTGKDSEAVAIRKLAELMDTDLRPGMFKSISDFKAEHPDEVPKP